MQKGSTPLPESTKSIGSVVGDVYLTISVKLHAATAWADQGHEVAWFQFRLADRPFPINKHHLAMDLSAKPQFRISRSTAHVFGQGYEFTFDTARGYLCNWASNGQKLIKQHPIKKHGAIPSFWRPATDNDVPQSLPYWQRFGIDQLTSQLKGLDIDQSASDKISVRMKTFLTPPVLAWGWECDISYVITNRGSLQIHVHHVQPTGSFPEHVPRIGLDLQLNKSIDQVTWYGLGPGESYPDKAASQQVGIWRVNSVADLQTPYDVPQENGNRLDTRWVKFSNSRQQGHGIRVRRIYAADSELFSFAASRHSAETIQSAKHPTDLIEEDALFVRLDAKVAGVGTGACGPGVRPDLLVKCKKTQFAFELESLFSLAA
jgi:beta-galactosidase